MRTTISTTKWQILSTACVVTVLGVVLVVLSNDTLEIIPIEQPYFTSSSTGLYEFPERPETMTITWERDYKKVQKRVDAYMKESGTKHVRGLAEIRGKKCKVYAPETMIDGDLNSYIFAHEISHCFGMVHE